MKHTPLREAAERIYERDEFSGTNLWGSGLIQPKTGWMPEPYCDQYLRDLPTIDYVVWSYGTPIAWCIDDRWVIPPVKYSQSTTRHQQIAMSAANWEMLVTV